MDDFEIEEMPLPVESLKPQIRRLPMFRDLGYWIIDAVNAGITRQELIQAHIRGDIRLRARDMLDSLSESELQKLRQSETPHFSATYHYIQAF